jgi:hypothetical protein
MERVVVVHEQSAARLCRTRTSNAATCLLPAYARRASTLSTPNRTRASRGMSWLNSMTWVAGIIGFAGTGYLTDTLGAAATCLIAALLAIAAAGLLGGTRTGSPRLCRSTGAASFWRSSRRRGKKLLPDS